MLCRALHTMKVARCCRWWLVVLMLVPTALFVMLHHQQYQQQQQQQQLQQRADRAVVQQQQRQRALCGSSSSSSIESDGNSTVDKPLQYSPSVELGQGLVSPTGEYILHPHAWPALIPLEEATVCLCTFSSVSKLYWLPWLLVSWSGPMSVAVYTPGTDYSALATVLSYFRRCHPTMESRVTFHVLYPRNNKPQLGLGRSSSFSFSSVDESSFDVSQLNCSDPELAVQQVTDSFQMSDSQSIAKLPQNHLRNLARRGCDAPYALVVDIDMIPSTLMFERLDLMLREATQCRKCARIVPVYEIDSGEKFLPANKPALLQMLEEKKAQQYHIAVYEKNQGNSNLNLWEKSGDVSREDALYWSMSETFSHNSSSSLSIEAYKEVPYRELYKIRSYEEFWEPIVVLGREAPSYDERFVGFGFCRSSLIYELHSRGYSFRMLDEPFLSHWGFQTTSHYPPHRVLEIKENAVRYDAMKRELVARYTVVHKRGRDRLLPHQRLARLRSLSARVNKNVVE